MLFSTDPVAVDRIGWDIVDAKRVEMGFCPVGQAGKVNINRFGTEGFNRRQPEHIFLAGRMLLTASTPLRVLKSSPRVLRS